MAHRIRVFTAFIAILFLFAVPSARADDLPIVQSENRPWEEAQATLTATVTDILKTNNLVVIASHETALLKSLGNAPASFATFDTKDKMYVLADGQPESAAASLLGSLLATSVHSQTNATSISTIVVPNPYPIMAFYLGSYYNEIGKHEDAVRVLDAALVASYRLNKNGGDTFTLLLTERGAAFLALKRWPEALEAYQRGLSIQKLGDKDRARMLRGCGFALTELGRLDEAEQSYRDSLKAEPDNRVAQNELLYIAKLRAGAPPTSPGQLVTPNMPKPPPLPPEKSL